MHKFIVWRIGATVLLCAALLGLGPRSAGAQILRCDDRPGFWSADTRLEITNHFTDIQFRVHDCAKKIEELRTELRAVKDQLERLSLTTDPALSGILLDLRHRVKALEDRDRSK